MKEMTSVVGIIDENINEEIKEICLKENEDLHLSERFFNFPLHISLKRTFQTDCYDDVKKDLDELLNKEIYCGKTYLVKNKDMLWLRVDHEKEILKLHNDIDELLLNKYGIEIDTFDKNYVPHITIFHKGLKENLDIMYDRLGDVLNGKEITIRKYMIGTKNHKDEHKNQLILFLDCQKCL